MGEEERALARGMTLDKYDMTEKMTVMMRICGVSSLCPHQTGFRGDVKIGTLDVVLLCLY
jgi:hypothetical protein